jgi:hypothetical protein
LAHDLLFTGSGHAPVSVAESSVALPPVSCRKGAAHAFVAFHLSEDASASTHRRRTFPLLFSQRRWRKLNVYIED